MIAELNQCIISTSFIIVQKMYPATAIAVAAPLPNLGDAVCVCYISRTIIGDIRTFFFRSSRHRSLFYRSHFIHLAFRNTLQKTPCEKSIWNRFYDLYKIADLGSRNGSSSSFFLSHDISVPPILNYLPMLRFQ